MSVGANGRSGRAADEKYPGTRWRTPRSSSSRCGGAEHRARIGPGSRCPRRVQRQLGVYQPDSATAGHHVRPEHGRPGGAFPAAPVEPEIAFVLDKALRRPGSRPRTRSGRRHDARRADHRFTLRDGSHGMSAPSPRARSAGSSRQLDGAAGRGGPAAGWLQPAQERPAGGDGRGQRGARLTGDGLVWLANTLGERGVVLEPGQVILPGSVTAAIPVGPGDTVTATFAGLGSVTARFAAQAPGSPEENR